ncbi:MAG: leucine-rich repeat domain-containing protein [Candidatus Delongbacteria bacterium]|nr:leucine-rich repeat domain-containing protein [Candidatus Delongbacteria bacterium]
MKIVGNEEQRENFKVQRLKNIFGWEESFKEGKKASRLRLLLVFIYTMLLFILLKDFIEVNVLLTDTLEKGYSIKVTGLFTFALYIVTYVYVSNFILGTIIWRKRAYSIMNTISFIRVHILLTLVLFFTTFLMLSTFYYIFYLITSIESSHFLISLYVYSLIFIIYLIVLHYVSLYLYNRKSLGLIKNEINSKLFNKLRNLLAVLHYIIVAIPVVVILYYLAMNSLSNIYKKSNDLENRSAEYFDTPFKRKMWWHSLDSEWKEIFKAIHLDYYRESMKEQLQCDLRLPTLPSDEYIKFFFNRKSLELHTDCKEYAFTIANNYTPVKVIDIPENGKYTDIKLLNNLTNLENLSLETLFTKNYSPLSKLTNLKSFTIYGAKLENLDLIQYLNDDLVSLSVVYSKLTNLKGIEKLNKLTFLNCSFNEITDLSCLNNLNSIEYLDCSCNKINSLKVLENMPNMKTLNLMDTDLQDLKELKFFKSIKTLEISGNSLVNLSGIENLTNLEYLDCSSNNIKSIKELSTLKNLKTLIIHDNPLLDMSVLDSLNVKEIIRNKDEYRDFWNHQNSAFKTIGYFDYKFKNYY